MNKPTYKHECVFPKTYDHPEPDKCLVCGKTVEEVEERKKKKEAKMNVVTREATVDRWLKRAVENAGGIMFKMHTTSQSGLPDRIVHAGNMTFYVELKTTNKPPTAIQIEMHKRIKARGIDVYVLDKRVEHLYDIFNVAYTTYEGRHYHKNPFKN
jgi:hypothetical protein